MERENPDDNDSVLSPALSSANARASASASDDISTEGSDLAILLERARNADRRALARLISKIENEELTFDELLATLPSGRLRPNPVGALADRQVVPFIPVDDASHTRTVGVTGAPGTGKSTLVDALIAELRTAGESIAVLAVDPSSPFTGGAILGDRVRMSSHALDSSVYIRSLATRGAHGGLSAAVPHVLRLLESVGFDWVIVETVGVGQVELDVAKTTDTTVVVLAPGFGDAVQANKAGLMEIADVFVVNKSDRPGAAETERDVLSMLELGGFHGVTESPDEGAHASHSPTLRRPAVIRCSAIRGENVGDLVVHIRRHGDLLRAGTGTALARRRQQRASDALRRSIMDALAHDVEAVLGDVAAMGVADGNPVSVDSILQKVAQRIVSR